MVVLHSFPPGFLYRWCWCNKNNLWCPFLIRDIMICSFYLTYMLQIHALLWQYAEEKINALLWQISIQKRRGLQIHALLWQVSMQKRRGGFSVWVHCLSNKSDTLRLRDPVPLLPSLTAFPTLCGYSFLNKCDLREWRKCVHLCSVPGRSPGRKWAAAGKSQPDDQETGPCYHRICWCSQSSGKSCGWRMLRIIQVLKCRQVK